MNYVFPITQLIKQQSILSFCKITYTWNQFFLFLITLMGLKLFNKHFSTNTIHGFCIHDHFIIFERLSVFIVCKLYKYYLYIFICIYEYVLPDRNFYLFCCYRNELFNFKLIFVNVFLTLFIFFRKKYCTFY